MDNVTYKLEQLENEGMIEQMHHDWYAFRIKNSWARHEGSLAALVDGAQLSN